MVRLSFFFMCLVLTSFSAQNVKWGVLSREEAELSDVHFETGASAVNLFRIGELTINDENYTLDEYGRIKILKTDGFDKAQMKMSFPKDANIDLKAAQTLNLVDGKTVINKIEDFDIIKSESENTVEIAIAFPNVKVGSVIEYKIRTVSNNIVFDTPWSFQSDIPTLYSKLAMVNKAYADYRIILNGAKLNQKYAGKRKVARWELHNIPSYKSFSHVYNTEDYREKIMFQFNVSRKHYAGYLSVNTWSGLKKLVNADVEESIGKGSFNKFSDEIRKEETKIGTLKNCIAYLQNNFQWNQELSAFAGSMNKEFLPQKTGNSADFNIFLHEILKQKGIQSHLAVTSLRSNGRMLADFPLLSNVQALINIVEIDDGEKLIIDAATSKLENIRYLQLDYYNRLVLNLDKNAGEFLEISPPLSEFLSSQELSTKITENQVVIENRAKGYFETDFLRQNMFNIFNGVRTSDSESGDFGEWKIQSQKISFENSSDNFLVIENPFTKLLKEMSVDNQRDYPICLNFPFLATIELKSHLAENQTIQIDRFEQKISAFGGKMQYQQEVTHAEDGIAIFTWSFLVNKTFFNIADLSEYLSFMQQVNAVAGKIAVIKYLWTK